MAEQQPTSKKPEQKKIPTNLDEAIEASDLEAVKRFIIDLQKEKIEFFIHYMDIYLASAVKFYGSAASKIVLALLEANPSHSDLSPLLASAIDAGRIETAAILLDKKADISQGFKDMLSPPLDQAIRLGNGDMVALLLKKKAKIGGTSMELAAMLGRTDIVTILIQHDSNVIELPTDQKETPLITALNHRKYDTACALLEAKADLSKVAAITSKDQLKQVDRSKSSRTALELIIEDHPLEIERFSSLRPGAIRPSRDQWYNALYGAIISDHDDYLAKAAQVSVLLAAKASVSYAPTGCRPPLELAKHWQHQSQHQLIIDIIQKKYQKTTLLASLHPNLARVSTAPATPYAPPQTLVTSIYAAHTPLLYAIEQLDHSAVEKLMAEKSDLPLRDKPHILLSMAANKSDIEANLIVLALLKAHEMLFRWPINMGERSPWPWPTSPRDFALAGAVKKGRSRVVGTLLAAKANPNHNPPFTHSHLAEACAMGDERMVEKLLEHKATIDGHAIINTVEKGHVRMVRNLLNRTPHDIDNLDLLNSAIDNNQEIMAKALIEAKASIERINPSDHHTPLRRAALKGLTSTVKALLEAKANANRVDRHEGNSALHMVFSKESDKNSDGQIVSALLDAKANPNLLNRSRVSPLYQAVAQSPPLPSAIAALVAAKADIHYVLDHPDNKLSIVEKAKRECSDRVVEALLRPALYINPLLGMTTSSVPDKKLSPSVTSTTSGPISRGGPMLNPLAAAKRRSTIFDPHTLRLVFRLADVSPRLPQKPEPISEPEPESESGPGPK